jgi:hypothetical protein
MNPRKSARSNAVPKENKMLQLANKMAKDCNDAEKAEMACKLEKMARLIRQNLHCVAGEPVQSIPLGVDRMPGAQVKTVARKTPRGFFMVNLGEAEQKEMRQLARQLGVEMRNMVRGALIDTKLELRERVRIQRLTDLGWSKQFAFFGRNSRTN